MAVQSGFEGYVAKTRVILFEAALAAANGLTPEIEEPDKTGLKAGRVVS